MSVELASELTKDLTSEEKINLLKLYKTQINELEVSLEKNTSELILSEVEQAGVKIMREVNKGERKK